MNMRRRKFFSRLVWATALVCLLCFGINSGALAESDKLVLRVMTRNMDAGTDLNYVTSATDGTTFYLGVLATIAEVDASNIPGRAAQLATEIAAEEPDLIALQEVTVWSIEDQPKGKRVYDQLALLQAALKKTGQHYRVAVSQTLTDIPIALLGLTARFTDNNAILVRADIPPGHLDVIGTETHLFDNFLPFTLPDGTVIPIHQGWLAVDVKIRGARFKFADTHLLSPVPGPNFGITTYVQMEQAGELLDGLSTTSLPIILAGDFNSDAEVPQHDPDRTPTAGLISSSGYQDVWHALHPHNLGYTWPLFREDFPPPDINPPADPFERIDLIFSHGPKALSVELTGTKRGQTGLYASDHVGVIADLSLENHRPDVPIHK